jgi:hypothetical protein
MTLADKTLDIIKSNWSGGVPADVVLVNANDSIDRSGTRRKDRDRPTELVVQAGFAGGDESRGGVGAEEVQRTVTVAVTGTHDGAEYGTVDDDDAFETVLDAVKTALRDNRRSVPPTVSPHSETWVEYMLGNETDARPNHHDNYGTVFDVTWNGHT